MALTNKLTAIGDAIRAKTGKTDLISLDQMPVEIESIQGGGGGGETPSAKWNDVTFIDYDGTVLYSYSLEEVQALTELPALPTHDGLVCQGWNWTLESIKSFNRPVIVGAMYITDDGATRLHIRITTVGRMTVPLCFCQTVANGVSIDWGDGSVSETLAGTGKINTTHTYAEPGDYIISLMPEDGCILTLSDGTTYNCVMGNTENSGKAYCNMLKEVYIGKNVTSIGDYAFKYCTSLASITVPDGVTSISTYTFRHCYSLASIIIPDSVTSIGDNVFQNCYSLASIAIPYVVTSIKTYAFQYCYSLASIIIPDSVVSIIGYSFADCYSLASIVIPDGVTVIGGNAFRNCYGARYYDFSSFTTVPELSNTSAFSSIPSDCQILIPSALYDEWKVATNWTTYANYMLAV